MLAQPLVALVVQVANSRSKSRHALALANAIVDFNLEDRS